MIDKIFIAYFNGDKKCQITILSRNDRADLKKYGHLRPNDGEGYNCDVKGDHRPPSWLERRMYDFDRWAVRRIMKNLGPTGPGH
jgi:hypothetical protein